MPDIVRDIRLPLGHTNDDLLDALSHRTGIRRGDLPAYTLLRRSVDARRKDAIHIQYSVLLGTPPQQAGIEALIRETGAGQTGRLSAAAPLRPVVAGFGPAGMFAALYLALAGHRPIVLERGASVDKRSLDVSEFWRTGHLSAISNVQFGEGGAGTFSDGKLTTGIKDRRARFILEEMVLAGAPAEILYQARPHVGTDRLRLVVRHLRQKIISLGGEIRFYHQLMDISCRDHHLQALQVQEYKAGASDSVNAHTIVTDRLILAPGHSARDTFEMLEKRGFALQSKPFSFGVRIEHPQALIDRAQYGSFAGHPQLSPAEYKMAVHLPSGRSVYTFCMCPGGEVIAASSEPGAVVTNGMSRQARDKQNANSALLVNVTPDDFPSADPLAGIYFQRSWEQKAYQLAGSNYDAPAQRLGDFMASAVRSGNSAGISRRNPVPDRMLRAEASYRPGVRWMELAQCLPGFVTAGLQEAIPQFDRKLPGFGLAEAVLTGPESRSSSPVRILRDMAMQSSVRGVFPCGEGAGYAGGIMSAAVDGLRAAQAALEN